jgi:hypothetical protein
MKSLRTWYWVATGAFCAYLLFAGVADVSHYGSGAEVFMRLGYPLYVMTIVGTAKILAAFAIIQTKWKTLKEWAFAGYTVDCIGAFASHYFAGDPYGWLLLSILLFLFMLVPYVLWKKLENPAG